MPSHAEVLRHASMMTHYLILVAEIIATKGTDCRINWHENQVQWHPIATKLHPPKINILFTKNNIN
jgi:hypothetical protein